MMAAQLQQLQGPQETMRTAYPVLGQAVAPPPQVVQQQLPLQHNHTSPGTVVFYSGQTFAAAPTVMLNAVPYSPPVYKYVPSDFRILSLITMAVCGFFSPLSLIFSIPAYMFSIKSKLSSEAEAIKLARMQGMVAAYLLVATYIFSLLIACVIPAVVVATYGPIYALQQCIKIVKERNDGVVPPMSSSGLSCTP